MKKAWKKVISVVLSAMLMLSAFSPVVSAQTSEDMVEKVKRSN